jgi:DNA-binding transcriptional regulator YiaG
MDARKFDYGVWWSEEDECFIARALTLQASTGYGDSPEAALNESITLATMNAESGHLPVARPLSQPGSAVWSADDIRELRRSLSLTQVALAEALNVTPRAVTNWEQGIHSPDGPSRRLLDIIAANPAEIHRWIIRREVETAKQIA